MDLHLKDRVCLVTGASSGISLATAIVSAAEGARVVATARSLAALDARAAAIEAGESSPPILLAADLAEESGAERLPEKLFPLGPP